MWPIGAHMGWMWLGWLFGIGLLVLLVWAVTHTAASSARPRDSDSPEAVLKRRYARGELDEQEYERRLTNLRK